MTKVIKQVTLEQIKKLQDKCDASGQVKLNLADVTRDLQSQIIINILVGQKFANSTLDYEDEHGKVSKVLLVDSIDNLFQWAILRELQMINVVFPELARYNITTADRRGMRNVRRLWACLEGMVNARRAEVARDGESVVDLLAILMQCDEYKDDQEKMYHELYGAFVAGMKTIMYATMNLIYYLTKHPEYK